MKCKACGYNDTEMFEETGCEEDIGNGDKDFILIEGNFIIDDPDDYYHRDKRVYLLACPKCNTVQMAEFI